MALTEGLPCDAHTADGKWLGSLRPASSSRYASSSIGSGRKHADTQVISNRRLLLLNGLDNAICIFIILGENNVDFDVSILIIFLLFCNEH